MKEALLAIAQAFGMVFFIVGVIVMLLWMLLKDEDGEE